MVTEKRLIDANDLIGELYCSDKELGTNVWETSEIVDQIDRMPTVDAVEVVHGRWEEPYRQFVECSNCGTGYVKYEFIEKANYCPNCGANMMDGDGNG